MKVLYRSMILAASRNLEDFFKNTNRKKKKQKCKLLDEQQEKLVHSSITLSETAVEKMNSFIIDSAETFDGKTQIQLSMVMDNKM